MPINNIKSDNVTHMQHSSKMNDIDFQQHVNHPPPIPLMSISIPRTEDSHKPSSSDQASTNKPTSSSSTASVSLSDDKILLTSTFINRVDISKFHFAHVIKVPHGTNLLASNNQSTTVCVNSIGNIVHLITPTGYHIRSSRWPDTDNKIIDLLW